MTTLDDVEALIFDVFGTVVDWRGSVSRQLSQRHELPDHILEDTATDWDAFTLEWRQGYYKHTRSVAEGGSGSTNIDIAHRQLLDAMLETPRWRHLSSHWDDKKREELARFWHNLDGWPDATEGLYALKRHFIIGTLSNGSARLLIDMAKHADLPWDIIFSGDIIGSYKPNPKMYLGAAEKLDLPPTKVAMVASHIHDLRAAASHGIKTIYIRRSTEDTEFRDSIKPKADGGEVDLAVDSFVEIAKRFNR
ncbi:haloacid dehalogenase [Cristinia sonorae]|uniref:Haloacid dehalogenase n=1 Tax=Cristinia sonorae TaxID=1940300 RepID=A0A8K0UGW7_9AGAR|nr:haloacid dehalogenase [Cristinia sonorae]